MIKQKPRRGFALNRGKATRTPTRTPTVNLRITRTAPWKRDAGIPSSCAGRARVGGFRGLLLPDLGDPSESVMRIEHCCSRTMASRTAEESEDRRATEVSLNQLRLRNWEDGCWDFEDDRAFSLSPDERLISVVGFLMVSLSGYCLLSLLKVLIRGQCYVQRSS